MDAPAKRCARVAQFACARQGRGRRGAPRRGTVANGVRGTAYLGGGRIWWRLGTCVRVTASVAALHDGRLPVWPIVDDRAD